jgi:hypothetical protein
MQKFVQLITLAGSPSGSKFIMIGRGVAAPHMGEVVDWRSFFRVCVRQAHNRPPALGSHILYINRRDSGQGCAFEGSHRYISSHEELSPENPSFGDVKGISSVNVYGRISAQKKHVVTLDGSKCTSRQDTQCAIVKSGNGSFQRSNSQFSPKTASGGDFKPKHPVEYFSNCATDFHLQYTNRLSWTSEKLLKLPKCSKFHSRGATGEFS